MLKRCLATPILTLLTAPGMLAQQGEILWADTFGSAETDYGVASLAAPDGTVWTLGSVEGFGFGSMTTVRRYERSGALLSSEQFSLSFYTTQKNAMVLDAVNGAYIGGWTRASSFASMNMILARVDRLGRLVWTRILVSPEWDRIQDLATDGQGGVFVGGRVGGPSGAIDGTEDAYVARYDAQGNELWSRTFGTSEYESVEACASDGAGGLFAVGPSRGSFALPSMGIHSAFIIRINGDGRELWRRGVTSDHNDHLQAAASDRRGGCYIGGGTTGNYAGPLVGVSDIIVAHFDAAGQELWRAQLGLTNKGSAVTSLAAHPDGGCVVSARSSGALGGSHEGFDDIHLLRYDDSGTLLGGRTIGSSSMEYADHVAYDRDGDLLVTGTATSDLFGASFGLRDAFVARVSADSIGATICAVQAPNSVGRTAVLRVFGSSFVEDDLLDLRVQNLPLHSFGHFMTSSQPATPATLPGSAGDICIGGAIGHFAGPGQVLNSGGSGTFALRIQPSSLPSPSGTLSAAAGQTWYFQAWYRDIFASTTSHMSTTASIMLR